MHGSTAKSKGANMRNKMGLSVAVSLYVWPYAVRVSRDDEEVSYVFFVFRRKALRYARRRRLEGYETHLVSSAAFVRQLIQ